MFCSRCGQTLEEKDLFCPRCGQKIESTQPRKSADFADDAFASKPLQETVDLNLNTDQQERTDVNGTSAPFGSGPIPPASVSGGPAAVLPRKKNKWIIPVVIAIVLLVLALFVVGGILVYTVVNQIMENGSGKIEAVSSVEAPVGEKELSRYLGWTLEDFKAETGVVLTGENSTYTNLDGSLLVTVSEETGRIDMLIASDRDVGFTICGVSIGMKREDALAAAQLYLPETEDFEDMLIGQDGEQYFAAYYDENDGIVNYLMYFTYEEDSSSGTNASVGTGIWYIGEALQEMWDFFGEEYELYPHDSGTVFFYPDWGLYFATDDVDCTGQSLISYVEMTQDAWFSDEIYIGMWYDEISLYVDLSEIYLDEESGTYQADFSMTLSGLECYGSFQFDGPDSDTAVSVGAYMACDDLL
ncbi:MAG: zinc-ribbon domain-containing protein [Oscillospiraceae bacterium]